MYYVFICKLRLYVNFKKHIGIWEGYTFAPFFGLLCVSVLVMSILTFAE